MRLFAEPLSSRQLLFPAIAGPLLVVIGCNFVFGFIDISSNNDNNNSRQTILIALLSLVSLLQIVLIKVLRWAIRDFVVILNGAIGLGLVLLLGISTIPTKYAEFGWFLVFIAFYHWGEYAITATYHPNTCSFDSFLINHSTAYTAAFVAGQTEYWLEKMFLFPELNWKGNSTITIFAICGLFVSEVFRKGGMITAGASFTHLVAYHKKDSHKLVTRGLYRIVRHPGYLGWFWWSIFTQILLKNPFCTVAYAAASWKFFADRIPEEEEQLMEFFPGEYAAYRAKTPTYIPFIP